MADAGPVALSVKPAPGNWTRRKRLTLTCCIVAVFAILCALIARPLFLVNPEGSTQEFRAAAFLQQDEKADPARPPAAATDPRGPAGSWRVVALPHVGVARDGRVASLKAPRVVTSWYRFEVTLPRDGGEADFYLPRWQTVGRVALYENGRLLWHSEGDIVWNGFNRPVLVTLPESGPATLLLRMDSVAGLGGGITEARVGNADRLFWRYRARLVLQCGLPGALAIALLALGTVVFFIAMARPTTMLYPLFIIETLLYAARAPHLLGPLDPRLMSPAWFGWITVSSMCWTIVVGWLFCCRMIDIRMRWLERVLVGGMAACTLAILPGVNTSAAIAALSVYAYGFCFVLSVPTLPVLFAVTWRRRSWAGMLVLFWNAVLFPAAAHDLLMADYRVDLDQIYLLPYAELDLCLSCMYVLYRRYLDAVTIAEQANATLVRRLREQDQVLRESYDRLLEVGQRETLVAERQRMMRDMHDGMGSNLTGVIHLAEAGASHGEIGRALRECLDDLKLTIDSLEPADAELLHLLAAFRFRFADRLRGQDIALEWAVTPLPPLPWLTPTAALHVLRILQEVVTNIVKHAGARRVRVLTWTDGVGVAVHVEDDGCGFVPGPYAAEGRGLHNIRWRAGALNGRAEWHPLSPGTRFTLWLPIDGQRAMPTCEEIACPDAPVPAGHGR